MSADMSGWLAQALATDSPVLPTRFAMQVWLHLGWSVVLAWLGANLSGRWLAGRARGVQGQWLIAVGLAVWAWVPGPGGAAYWLGLAFQAPSVVGVVVCALLLGVRLRGAHGLPVPVALPASTRLTDGRVLLLAVTGVLAGWALLLDSFAVLPLSLYAWGFSPAALGVVVLIALLPWVAGLHLSQAGSSWLVAVVPLSALVFVVWRLPTGNVWDAVLDPWAWFVLQGWLVKQSLQRYKNNS
jgi:hypothetical protein